MLEENKVLREKCVLCKEIAIAVIGKGGKRRSKDLEKTRGER